ncbi:MAG: hypothetical protein II797_03600 [Clostridia bacterium]|nr:hypothetical protein [Clostridia bacterium]
MKKILFVLTVLFLLLSLFLSACVPYTSSYSAVGFVHSQYDKNASMSFYEFTGKMVFTLNWNEEETGTVRCDMTLEEGDVTVFLGDGQTETELVRVRSGDDFTVDAGTLKKGPVYLIVQTNGKSANGSFVFTLENAES